VSRGVHNVNTVAVPIDGCIFCQDGNAAFFFNIVRVHHALIRIGFFILPLGAKFWAPVIAVLAMINVIYASYIALAQRDIKYMIAYSSVSHMGYVLLGFAALNVVSVSGAVAYMVAHGIMLALFFSQVGYVYEKTELRSVGDLWGLAHHMPHITVGFMLAGLCSPPSTGEAGSSRISTPSGRILCW